MDTVRDERGQTLVIVVLLLGIAAVVIVGLRAGQERFFAVARSHRAGEAAVEAASAALADAYVAHLAAVRARSQERPRPTPNVPALVADPRTIEKARVAADELARENGAGRIETMNIGCESGRVEARLTLGGYSHHAGFAAPECFRP
jgi:Tfp pilus assembly protein PilX